MPASTTSPDPASPTAAASARPARAVARPFGRFELRELLGRSQRTMVWMAFDPRSAQEMLLTLPRVAPADADALAAWVAEAKLASRLDHPFLAPVIEVGTHEQWPYVACDRLLGQTADEWLATHPQPGHNEIAGWLCEALEGLAFAHEAGVAHGDLQPHKLLIDERGHVRVLALAAGLGAAAGGANSNGTRGANGGGASYRGMSMDPARLQAHRALAENDILALGLIAHQWLAGAPAHGEADTGRLIERLAPLGRDSVRLPWTTPQPVSEVLRTIVNRATHQQPRQRYLSARTLLRALNGWREADARDTGGPIALLVDRLHTVGHLPAMPGVAQTVARLSRMEQQRTSDLAEEVLRDFALSFELLRQVNSLQVQSSQASGNGPVLTIRRSIAMLGLDGVRRAAGGLRGWPGPLGEAGAAALRQAFEHARLAGLLAQLLRPAGYDAEVVFLMTVLQNLGRLVLHYHFADDAEQVRQLMRAQPGKPATADAPEQPEQPGMAEQAASFAVLGCDIDAMTTAVARHWGLGDEVLQMMRRLPVDRPVHAPDDDGAMLRTLASAANETVDVLTHQATTRITQSIEAVAKRYARVLELTPRDLGDAIRRARQALAQGGALVSDDGTGDAVMHDTVGLAAQADGGMAPANSSRDG